MKVESVSHSYMAISLAPSLIGFLASKKTAVSTKAQQMPSQFHLKTQVVEQEGGAFHNLKGIGEGVPLRSSKQNMSTKNQSDICSLPSLPSRDIYIYIYIHMLKFTFPQEVSSSKYHIPPTFGDILIDIVDVHISTGSTLRCSSPLFCRYLLCWQVLQHLLLTKNSGSFPPRGFFGKNPGNPRG